MESKDFIFLRKKLDKTQLQMAQLLGVSTKAIHSYEQGWRSIPHHIERQVLFLVSRIRGNRKPEKPCWVIKKCPPELKKQCPAWEFQAGKLCWFINGTICGGTVHKKWKDKIAICRSCKAFIPILD